MNRKELVTKLAQAISDIGEQLPQIEGLAKLYPTQPMRLAIANIYAQILVFCKTATKWYNRNPVKRALLTVTSPWELEFQDVVDKIKENSRKIRELSMVETQKELRYMHVAVQRIENFIQPAFGKIHILPTWQSSAS